MERPRAAITLHALLERWRRDGLPTYAQFDNDTIFQGGHRFADSVGRVSRLCLALGVIPVFAPPREPGFQNAIEGFNGLWQSKVWQRHRFPDVATLGRLRTLHRGLSRQDRHAPRGRPQPARLPHRLQARSRAPRSTAR